jgi:hypothetical protein
MRRENLKEGWRLLFQRQWRGTPTIPPTRSNPPTNIPMSISNTPPRTTDHFVAKCPLFSFFLTTYIYIFSVPTLSPRPPSPLTHPTKSLSITQNPFSSWNWVFSFYAFVLWNPNTPLSNCCLTVVRGEGDLFSTPGCEWVCVVQEFTGDLTLKLERNEELPTSSNLKAPIS